jgi:hypothetical protein
MSDCYPETAGAPSYHNLAIECGFNYFFEIDITDGSTGAIIDLTRCLIVMTVCDPSNFDLAFVLSTDSGDISVDITTGVITVSIPGYATSNLSKSQYLYDVIVVDTLLVSRSAARGILTTSPVA